MDKKKRNVAALGVLTMLAVIVFFWGFYYLLGNPVLKGGMDVVVALENGAGLKRGDRVQLQGVEVGSVKSVDLHDAQRVIAVLRLNDKLPLPADTRARITGDVFGAHAVELVPGTAMVKLEKGDTIGGMSEPGSDRHGGRAGHARVRIAHSRRFAAFCADRARLARHRLRAAFQRARAARCVHGTAHGLFSAAPHDGRSGERAYRRCTALGRDARGRKCACADCHSQRDGTIGQFTGQRDRQDRSWPGHARPAGQRLDAVLEFFGAAREIRTLAADVTSAPASIHQPGNLLNGSRRRASGHARRQRRILARLPGAAL